MQWSLRAGLDARDSLSGRRNPLVPPRRLGLPSQLHAVGAGLVEHALVDAAGLQPHERVLDIGCGPGRVAAHLSGYLDPASGSYEGFDVMPAAIRWCQRQITPRHPRFRFQLAEVHNGSYSPAAQVDPSEYRFPYPDDDFDVAFAASLYTHMFASQVANYLRETARVLRPGGRAAASFFLLNDESEELLEGGIEPGSLVSGGTLDFGRDIDDGRGGRYRTTHASNPEARIALHEADVRRLHAEAGLEITDVRPGHWCGREDVPSWLEQDWVIAVAR